MYIKSTGGFRTFTFVNGIETHPDISNILIWIDKDRYTGAYSDHLYTAWVGPKPDDIDSGDPICSEFWDKWKDKALYGGGETPQDAFKDLAAKLADSDFGVIDEDDPKVGCLRVVFVDEEGCYPTAYRYPSEEFNDWLSERKTPMSHQFLILNIQNDKDAEPNAVKIKLRPDLAPKHVAQITALAEEGFYDGVPFHRVIPGFMAQGGDGGNRNGTGGSSKPNIPQEFSKEPHVRGTASMARTNDPNSANSQFFICFDEARFLDRQYTVWGSVVEGMEHIDALPKGEPPRTPGLIKSTELVES